MMKIVHLSFIIINDQENPVVWVNKLDFYTGILRHQAEYAEVHSIHCIAHEGILVKDLVTYHFLHLGRNEKYFSPRLNQYVANIVPDIVIVHGLLFPFQLIMLRRYFKSPIRIFLQHHAERPLNFVKSFFQKEIDKYVEGYFFTSKLLAEPWIKAKQISDPSKIHEVVEISSTFCRMEREAARNYTHVNYSPAYLWVGRMDRNKDPMTLVMAFIRFLSDCPAATLFIIYQTNDILKEVKSHIKGYEGNIKLIGKVDHDFIKYWYNSVDFIVSTSHYEAGGTSVSEAMSCGCIPVLSNIPSFTVMTNEEACGKLFMPGDIDSLHAALCWSSKANIEDEREKVSEQFNSNLSFRAISDKIHSIISGR